MKNNNTDTKAHYLSLDRTFSSAEVHPYDEITWTYRTAEIIDDKGSAIFKQENIEVPEANEALVTEFIPSKSTNVRRFVENQRAK